LLRQQRRVRPHRWTVEPGRFTVLVGVSSADIRLTGNFTLTRPDGTVPEEVALKN
jgi:hypothetical protein